MKLFEVEPTATELKDNEWWTQAKYVDAARLVLGGQIDLDPASCWEANQTVRASHYYTKEQDGLRQPWVAKSVWLNPPFSRDNVARGMEPGDHPRSILQAWVEKLIAEYRCGNVSAAIMLTKADSKQVWFQPLLDYTICLARDRVYFNRPGQEPEKMMFGTAFVYLGPDVARFVQVFRKFGRVLQAIDDPVEEPTLWSWEASA